MTDSQPTNNDEFVHMKMMEAYQDGCHAGIAMARERLIDHGFHDALIALEFTKQEH